MIESRREIEEALARITSLLEPLDNLYGFVGGAVIPLLLNEYAGVSVRPTKDVDIVFEIRSYAEFHNLEESLRQLGFRQRHLDRRTGQDEPLCRWYLEDLMIDVLPSHESAMAHNINRWFRFLPVCIEDHTLANGSTVRVASAPLIIATKVEAFLSRGDGDYLASHDLEDMLALFEGREELLSEIERTPHEIRAFLAERMQSFLDSRGFRQAIAMSVDDEEACLKIIDALKKVTTFQREL